jgi:hypothetical protein
MEPAEKTPIRLTYERRNRDLDPQLVWRGKDEQDWSDLVVAAAPLDIQEKVHPKVLIDDLLRFRSRSLRAEGEAIHSWDRRAAPRLAMAFSPTCSPTSMDCRTQKRRPSSTPTTRTGRTG